MIEIVINKIKSSQKINLGINNIIIEDFSYFRDIYYQFEEEIVILENTEICKNYFKIDSILGINLNDKKISTNLNKNFARYVNRNFNDRYIQLIELIKDFVSELKIDFDYEVECEDEIPIESFIKFIGLTCKEEDDFTLNIVNFFKIVAKLLKVNYFITFNLKSYISSQEHRYINDELEKLGLFVIDFSPKNCDKTHTSNVCTIDEEFCII